MVFYSATVEAYVAVAHHFAERIRTGEYPPGSKLPAATSIAANLDVSVDVARRALRELGRIGLTEAQRGRGTWVREARPVEVLDMTAPDEDLPARLAELGATSARDRVSTRLPLVDEARALGCPPGSPVLEVVREYLDTDGAVIATDRPRLLAGESTELLVPVTPPTA